MSFDGLGGADGKVRSRSDDTVRSKHAEVYGADLYEIGAAAGWSPEVDAMLYT